MRATAAVLAATVAGPAAASDYAGLAYPLLIASVLVVLFAAVTCIVLFRAIARPAASALVPATIFGPLLALPVVAVVEQAQSWLGWAGISAAIAVPVWGLTWFFLAKIRPRFREIEREAREWKPAVGVKSAPGAAEDGPDRSDAGPERDT
ncbi:hypothetical protein K4L06_19935 [Lysobacter sp. BMK333-48F3]|uniref:hypothetical protein n=1 Tax=Lysobacter sp. BMK333-48F3 TaxID=2867962 RepID=UPI001C8B544F|nr:hypothetical protein [Lysobacter sp. BMK333-48F3]MBX9403585.1 hypothetical protein [Lysobacter sp. BMK333-48F3]